MEEGWLLLSEFCKMRKPKTKTWRELWRLFSREATTSLCTSRTASWKGCGASTKRTALGQRRAVWRRASCCWPKRQKGRSKKLRLREIGPIKGNQSSERESCNGAKTSSFPMRPKKAWFIETGGGTKSKKKNNWKKCPKCWRERQESRSTSSFCSIFTKNKKSSKYLSSSKDWANTKRKKNPSIKEKTNLFKISTKESKH